VPYSDIDYGRGDPKLEVGIDVTQFRLQYGSTEVLGPEGGMAFGQTHLIVGKLNVGAGDDTISVWADPADLNSLGTPLTGSVNIGDSLYLVGLGGYNTAPDNAVMAAYDAIRLSNGTAAFADVTGVPEPGAIVLLLTGLVGLAAYAWRKRR
jgi:hypothetical protein